MLTTPAYIYRLSEDIPLPTQGTEVSAGIDLYAIGPATYCKDYSRDYIKCLPGEVQLVSTGIVARAAANHYFHLYLRSSTPIKYPGIILANGVGIIDPDYCGPEDEIKIPLLNTAKYIHYIEKGSRIAQLVQLQFNPQIILEIKDEAQLRLYSRGSRGGLGSTG